MRTRAQLILFVVLLATGIVSAQPPPASQDGRWGDVAQGPPPPQHPNRPPMERGFHGGPSGRWWMDPDLVQRLGLTADQQKRIDSLFQQNRLKLIDLSAAVEKEEAILEPLLEADRPEESQVLAQIDRVAQARAELEKANARMLLGFRGVLTLDQWKKLQAEAPHGRREHP
jgi:protein CpxP